MLPLVVWILMIQNFLLIFSHAMKFSYLYILWFYHSIFQHVLQDFFLLLSSVYSRVNVFLYPNMMTDPFPSAGSLRSLTFILINFFKVLISSLTACSFLYFLLYFLFFFHSFSKASFYPLAGLSDLLVVNFLEIRFFCFIVCHCLFLFVHLVNNFLSLTIFQRLAAQF